jgi:hypothetical protein
MEYDVAAGLVGFGWWVTFYAHTAEEGAVPFKAFKCFNRVTIN